MHAPMEVPFPEINQTSATLKTSRESPDIEFAENFTQNGGKFVYCEDFEHFYKIFKWLSNEKSWRNIHCWHPQLVEFFQQIDFRKCKIGHILDRSHAGIMTCDAIIAQTGSIVLSSALPCGRSLGTFPKSIIVLATLEQVVKDFRSALQLIERKYEIPPTMIGTITGPAKNRTISMKSMEGGVGPIDVYLFFIDAVQLIMPKIEKQYGFPTPAH